MLKLVNLMLENVVPEEEPCAMPTEILPEAEMNHRTMNLDKAYDVFNQSYIKSTGKSWEKDKFIERAYGWTFFGDENGYVAVRPQQSGMVKFVGVAGSLKSIYKGIQELKAKYNSVPVWGMVSKEISDQVGKLGFKTLRLKNDLSSKIFLKLLKTVIPASVFGGAEINGINSDGTLSFQYKDVGEVNKVLIGNDKYFDVLRDKILAHDKIPEFMKVRLTKLFNDPNAITEDYDISEERKNPDINIREPFAKKLRDYAREDDMFVSFTAVDKAGINPRSKWGTPLGIYCYPLKLSVTRYKSSTGGIKFPFAMNEKNAMFLKKNPGIKELVMSKYSSADGDKDIQRLIEIYEKDKSLELDLDAILLKAKNETRFPDKGVGIFWYFCNLLAEELSKIQKTKPQFLWNKFLRKDLGYDFVIDDLGWGVIHSNEPLQSFFTHIKAFTLVEGTKNPNAKQKSRIDFLSVAKYPKAVAALLSRRDYTREDLRKLFDYYPRPQEMVDTIIKIKNNDLSIDDIYAIFVYSKLYPEDAAKLVGPKNLEKLDDEEVLEIYNSVYRKGEMIYQFGEKLINKLSTYSMRLLFSDDGMSGTNSEKLVNFIVDNINPSELNLDLIDVLSAQVGDTVEFAKKVFKKIPMEEEFVYKIIKNSKDRIAIINELGVKKMLSSLKLSTLELIKTDSSPTKLINFFGEDILKFADGPDLQELLRNSGESDDEERTNLLQIMAKLPTEKFTPHLVVSILYYSADLYETVKMFPPGTFDKVSGDRIGDIMVKHGPIHTLNAIGTNSLIDITRYQLNRVLAHLTDSDIGVITFLHHIGRETVGKMSTSAIQAIISSAGKYDESDLPSSEFIIDSRGDALTSDDVYAILWQMKDGTKLLPYIGKNKIDMMNNSEINGLFGKLWNDYSWTRAFLQLYGKEIPIRMVKIMFSNATSRKELVLIMFEILGEADARRLIEDANFDISLYLPKLSTQNPLKQNPLNESLDYIKYCRKFMM